MDLMTPTLVGMNRLAMKESKGLVNGPYARGDEPGIDNTPTPEQ
ncbi:hypothetical protein BN8_00520 [Fibrisoma limi BUZ 3]|uniref:Uncharacterized protein n=1 Tax=Fibrisoma limi BUZ 3 TaxID=1185876 RepID=I2GCG6_9BACT|nr:hypothetical protein BN8_00520 [Fibrisoma limi BUZ 3]